MKSLLLPAILLLCEACFAQNDKLNVDGAGDLNKALPDSIRFQYPAFINSIIYFKDATSGRAWLNYNLVVGEMQFIDIKGDTLSIADEATIKYITINADTFCYNQKNCLQIVPGNQQIKLAKKQVYNIADIRKRGAYGQLSSTGGISIITSINNNGRHQDLSEDINTTLNKKVTYYIGDTYNHFLPATKKNMYRIFENKEAALHDYFAANKVDFFSEADLKKLIASLQSM